MRSKKKSKSNEELNEMRNQAGLDHKESDKPKDEYIKNIQAIAGL